MELGEDLLCRLFVSCVPGVRMGGGTGRGRTRLLCWTASGTSGLIRREISCFVGGIFGVWLWLWLWLWVGGGGEIKVEREVGGDAILPGGSACSCRLLSQGSIFLRPRLSPYAPS